MKATCIVRAAMQEEGKERDRMGSGGDTTEETEQRGNQ